MTNTSAIIPVPSVSSEPHVGGKKRTSKKAAPAKKPSSSKGKKGGALLDDVKNLAVPFAILLAKQGLQNLFDEKKTKTDKKPKTEKKTKTEKKPAASKPSSSKRRTSIAGGSACTAGCGMAGGHGKKAASIQTQFDSIAREIEQFLQKY